MSGSTGGGRPQRNWVVIGLVAVAVAVLLYVVVVATGNGEFF